MEFLKFVTAMFIAIILIVGCGFICLRDFHKQEFREIKKKTKNICLWVAILMSCLFFNHNFLGSYITEFGFFRGIILIFIATVIELLLMGIFYNTLLLLPATKLQIKERKERKNIKKEVENEK